MSEYRVYYDDLGEFASKVDTLCNGWDNQLTEVNNQILELMASDAIEGESAETIKRYMWQVHHATVKLLKTLVKNFNIKSKEYYLDYCELDSGDGSKYGQRYTTFVSSEIKKGGSVEKRLNGIISDTKDIRADISKIYKKVSNITEKNHSIPDDSKISKYLKDAEKKATDLDSFIQHTEHIHSYDFKDIDVMLAQISNIIEHQLSASRTHAISYHNGEIHQMCDTQQLILSAENCENAIVAFESSEKGKKASALLQERQKLIEQEEKDNRKWVKWVSTGVSVVATATVIVASATGVGVVGVVIIGAVTGTISGATSCVSDQYYEEGNLNNLDYNELLKDSVVGGIGGAIGGYTAAVGFAAKAGGVALTTTDRVVVALTEESAKTVTKLSVDTGAVIGYEVNRLITGDDSGIQKQYDTLQKDTNEGVKNILVKPIKAYVSGVIEEDFKWDTEKKKVESELDHLFTGKDTNVKKSVIKKGLEAGEKQFVNTAATETADQAITMTYNSVTGKYSGTNGSEELGKDMRKGWSKISGKSTSAFISGTTSSVTNEKINSIKHTYIKEPAKVVNDTFNNTGSKVSEKVITMTANNTINAMSKVDERESITLKELWSDTLQDGRSLVKSAADSASKKAGDYANEEYRKEVMENTHKGMNYEEIRDNYLYEEFN